MVPVLWISCYSATFHSMFCQLEKPGQVEALRKFKQKSISTGTWTQQGCHLRSCHHTTITNHVLPTSLLYCSFFGISRSCNLNQIITWWKSWTWLKCFYSTFIHYFLIKLLNEYFYMFISEYIFTAQLCVHVKANI